MSTLRRHLSRTERDVGRAFHSPKWDWRELSFMDLVEIESYLPPTTALAAQLREVLDAYQDAPKKANDA